MKQALSKEQRANIRAATIEARRLESASDRGIQFGEEQIDKEETEDEEPTNVSGWRGVGRLLLCSAPNLKRSGIGEGASS